MRKISIVIIVITMLSVSACKKIQNRVLIKGKWEVERVKSDFLTVDNSMEILIPGYVSNDECCQYIVDFKDDETVTGTFYKDKQVAKVDSGVWNLDKYNLLYIKLGKYIDGTYDISKESKRYYILTTDSNSTEFISNTPIVSKVTQYIRKLKD
jgi:hypothetical protein